MLSSARLVPTLPLTCLLALAALLPAGRAAATPFHSISGRYTIDVPDGWIVARPARPTPANDVPVTRGGVPLIDVQILRADPKERFAPIGFISVERTPAGGDTDLQYEDDDAPGNWHTKIDPQLQTFKATREVPIFLSLRHRSEARGWITPGTVITLSLSTTGSQYEAAAPALQHIADSFRADNPGLLLPSAALVAVAAMVVWVARRARR